MAYNVIVVDDSAVMRTMIIRTLTLCRVPLGQVFQAAHGREALEILEREWVDLALVDINMPVMDGEELIRALRADPATADLPVLVVSTESSSTRIARVQELGARFIRKPFTPERLRDHIIALTGVTDHDACDAPAVGGDLDF
jgi:two-component system, chemotaxis family, chemotaxis protein CheY